jgi:hypothetical protein
LGGNTGGRAVMLRPMRFLCVGVWTSTKAPCNHMHAEFGLAPEFSGRLYCVSQVVPVFKHSDECLTGSGLERGCPCIMARLDTHVPDQNASFFPFHENLEAFVFLRGPFCK